MANPNSINLATLGSSLASRGYRLIRPLGSGVYAQAYLADKAGSLYTIKVYLSHSNSQELHVLQAIQAVAQPHLPVWEEFIVLGQQEILVTQHLPGQNLDKLLKHHPQLSQTVDWLDQLLHDIITALASLERVGIAHRDVKPDNILYDGLTHRFSLIDLGLACSAQGCEQLIIAGSLEFLLPEIQMLLDHNLQTKVNVGLSYDKYRRGDLYSLGVTAYEIINKTLPYPFLPKHRQGYNVIHDFTRPIACHLAGRVDPQIKSRWGHSSLDLDNMINILLYSQDNITAQQLLSQWWPGL